MRRQLVLAALVLLPLGTVAAQGRSRSQANKHEDAKYADDNLPKGPAIRGRDFEDLNPLKLFIDKKKDLKLSDAQVDGLKKAESALRESNKPLYQAIDSLAREMKPPMNATSASEERMRNARRGLDQTISSINDSYMAASKEATAGFDADQQAKATELLGKLKEDTEKRIREKTKSGH